MAAAVDQQGHSRQHHSRRGIPGHQTGIPELKRLQTAKDGDTQLPVPHGIEGNVVPPGGIHQGVQGGQQLHPAGVLLEGPAAVEDLIGHLGTQGVHHKDQHVQNDVEGGQSQHVAGELGAEHGEGIQEEQGSQSHPEAVPQASQGHGGQLGGEHGQLHQRSCGIDQHVGHNDEGQTGEVVGDKQVLSAHGHGMDGGGRAVVKEIAKHRHDDEHAVSSTQQNHSLTHICVQIQTVPVNQVDLLLHVQVVVAQLVEEVQGHDEGPHDRPDGPQGPEPGQIFPIESRIKERCHGPHSPHLPARK